MGGSTRCRGRNRFRNRAVHEDPAECRTGSDDTDSNADPDTDEAQEPRKANQGFQATLGSARERRRYEGRPRTTRKQSYQGWADPDLHGGTASTPSVPTRTSRMLQSAKWFFREHAPLFEVIENTLTEARRSRSAYRTSPFHDTIHDDILILFKFFSVFSVPP